MRKIIAMFLSLSILFSLSAQAIAVNTSEVQGELIYSDGNTELYLTKSNGVNKISQYENSKLVSEATFVDGDGDSIRGTRYENGKKVSYKLDGSKSTIEVSSSALKSEPSLFDVAGLLGTINYTYIDYASAGKCSAKVTYSYGNPVQTVYSLKTTQSQIFELASLVAFIMSLTGLPGVVVSKAAATVMNLFGIAVGVGSFFLSNSHIPLNCDRTTYTFNFINANNLNQKVQVYSDYYKIKENGVYYGNEYWTWYNPRTCWKNTDFGNTVMAALFGYSYYSIDSWV